ncbi:MAG TPA: lipopolysaccharide kinase InaA family protein [Candidatus Binatia bacterium]|nr:lipopolysaccharide kinase InaA family protein [Candidatus Binatia bacterium]
MTPLRIRIRESRLALPSTPDGILAVDVPADPIKVDRGTVVFPWQPPGEGRQILKVYGSMGVLNWMRKQVVGYRARREFRTLALLRAASVDCCEPTFWGTGRAGEYGLFEMLATREVPGTTTVADRAKGLEPSDRADLVGRVFEQIARMHRAGVYHGAPYLTNVLMGDVASSPITMLDLEKSVRFPRDIRGSRMASFDLLNLVNSTLACMGKGYARGGLERYGLDGPAIDAIFAAVRAYRSSKFQRYRRRAEYLALGVLSRTLAGRAGTA